MTMEKLQISVVINTYNEEENIVNCIESVKWANEIIICDMYSTDNTVILSQKYTDKIYYYEKIGYVEPARHFAVEQASNDWILILDADEMVPYKMYEYIKKIINENNFEVIYFPRNNFFFGKVLKATGWGGLQDMHARLFKKGFLELPKEIHAPFRILNQAKVDKVLDINCGILHFNYIDIEQFISKLNRYTTVEAENIFDGLKKDSLGVKKVLLLFKEFISRFIFKKGYLDGKIGFYLTMLMLFYRITTFFKIMLMKQHQTKEINKNVKNIKKNMASDLLEEYNK